MAFVLTRTIIDCFLYMLFMRKAFADSRLTRLSCQRLFVSAVIVIALLGTVAVFENCSPVFDVEDALDPAATIIRLVLTMLLGWALLGLPLRVALFEGLMYTTIMRVGYTLYCDTFLSFCFMLDPSSISLCTSDVARVAGVSLLGIPFLLWLAPKEEELDGRAIGNLSLFVLVLALLVYVSIGFLSRHTISFRTALYGILNSLILSAFCLVARWMTVNGGKILQEYNSNALLQEEHRRLLEKIEYDEDIKTLHHDLKHAISLLANQEGAADLARRLEENSQEATIAIYTDNAILDALLGSVAQTCAESDIRFEAQFNMGSCDFIDDYDICVIFGNALQNAIEAVRKSVDPDKRFICFEAAEQTAALVFRIENPYESPVKTLRGKALSSKQGDLHGHGLRSIAARVEAYGGCAFVDTQDETFTLTILIPRQASSD